MKKMLLFFAALMFTGMLNAQTPCTDIFISEYVEGWYNNKALEIYNPTNGTITLDNMYRLIRWDNGKTTSDQDPLYTLPLTGTIEAYKVMVIIQDTVPAGQDTMVWPELRKKGTWLAPYDYNGTSQGGRCVFWNGDDAISIQKNVSGTWKDIDIFGEIGVRPLDWQGGTTGAWTDTKPYWRGAGTYLTKDQTLIRKAKVKFGIDRIAMSHYGDSVTGGFPHSFNAFAEYDSLPANAFDSLGFHRCDCKSSSSVGNISGNSGFSVGPNPVTNGRITVSSANAFRAVEVLTVFGEILISKQYANRPTLTSVELGRLSGGIYMVRLTGLDNRQETRKIIVQ